MEGKAVGEMEFIGGVADERADHDFHQRDGNFQTVGQNR